MATLGQKKYKIFPNSFFREKLNIIYKRCFTKKHLYQWEEREFRGGSDKKMRRMWLGLDIVVAGLPPTVSC